MDINGVELEFLGHSGFLISCKSGKRIAIDPYNISGGLDKVDLILITHSHYDHCSIKDIKELSKPGTIIVITADGQSKITKIEAVDMQVIEVGDEMEFGNVKIKAVPAYNVNKDFHPKKEGWVGYLIKINGTVIYHAGDSDNIPEIKKLTGHGKHDNYFVALLPVSGKFTMDAEEAAEVANLLNPNLCIPMHYGSGIAGTTDDAKKFVELCKDFGLNAVVLEKI